MIQVNDSKVKCCIIYYQLIGLHVIILVPGYLFVNYIDITVKK